MRRLSWLSGPALAHARRAGLSSSSSSKLPHRYPDSRTITSTAAPAGDSAHLDDPAPPSSHPPSDTQPPTPRQYQLLMLPQRTPRGKTAPMMFRPSLVNFEDLMPASVAAWLGTATAYTDGGPTAAETFARSTIYARCVSALARICDDLAAGRGVPLPHAHVFDYAHCAATLSPSTPLFVSLYLACLLQNPFLFASLCVGSEAARPNSPSDEDVEVLGRHLFAPRAAGEPRPAMPVQPDSLLHVVVRTAIAGGGRAESSRERIASAVFLCRLIATEEATSYAIMMTRESPLHLIVRAALDLDAQDDQSGQSKRSDTGNDADAAGADATAAGAASDALLTARFADTVYVPRQTFYDISGSAELDRCAKFMGSRRFDRTPESEKLVPELLPVQSKIRPVPLPDTLSGLRTRARPLSTQSMMLFSMTLALGEDSNARSVALTSFLSYLTHNIKGILSPDGVPVTLIEGVFRTLFPVLSAGGGVWAIFAAQNDSISIARRAQSKGAAVYPSPNELFHASIYYSRLESMYRANLRESGARSIADFADLSTHPECYAARYPPIFTAAPSEFMLTRTANGMSPLQLALAGSAQMRLSRARPASAAEGDLDEIVLPQSYWLVPTLLMLHSGANSVTRDRQTQLSITLAAAREAAAAAAAGEHMSVDALPSVAAPMALASMLMIAGCATASTELVPPYMTEVRPTDLGRPYRAAHDAQQRIEPIHYIKARRMRTSLVADYLLFGAPFQLHRALATAHADPAASAAAVAAAADQDSERLAATIAKAASADRSEYGLAICGVEAAPTVVTHVGTDLLHKADLAVEPAGEVAQLGSPALSRTFLRTSWPLRKLMIDHSMSYQAMRFEELRHDAAKAMMVSVAEVAAASAAAPNPSAKRDAPINIVRDAGAFTSARLSPLDRPRGSAAAAAAAADADAAATDAAAASTIAAPADNASTSDATGAEPDAEASLSQGVEYVESHAGRALQWCADVWSLSLAALAEPASDTDAQSLRLDFSVGQTAETAHLLRTELSGILASIDTGLVKAAKAEAPTHDMTPSEQAQLEIAQGISVTVRESVEGKFTPEQRKRALEFFAQVSADPRVVHTPATDNIPSSIASVSPFIPFYLLVALVGHSANAKYLADAVQHFYALAPEVRVDLLRSGVWATTGSFADLHIKRIITNGLVAILPITIPSRNPLTLAAISEGRASDALAEQLRTHRVDHEALAEALRNYVPPEIGSGFLDSAIACCGPRTSLAAWLARHHHYFTKTEYLPRTMGMSPLFREYRLFLSLNRPDLCEALGGVQLFRRFHATAVSQLWATVLMRPDSNAAIEFLLRMESAVLSTYRGGNNLNGLNRQMDAMGDDKILSSPPGTIFPVITLNRVGPELPLVDMLPAAAACSPRSARAEAVLPASWKLLTFHQHQNWAVKTIAYFRSLPFAALVVISAAIRRAAIAAEATEAAMAAAADEDAAVPPAVVSGVGSGPLPTQARRAAVDAEALATDDTLVSEDFAPASIDYRWRNSLGWPSNAVHDAAPLDWAHGCATAPGEATYRLLSLGLMRARAQDIRNKKRELPPTRWNNEYLEAMYSAVLLGDFATAESIITDFGITEATIQESKDDEVMKLRLSLLAPSEAAAYAPRQLTGYSSSGWWYAPWRDILAPTMSTGRRDPFPAPNKLFGWVVRSGRPRLVAEMLRLGPELCHPQLPVCPILRMARVNEYLFDAIARNDKKTFALVVSTMINPSSKLVVNREEPVPVPAEHLLLLIAPALAAAIDLKRHDIVKFVEKHIIFTPVTALTLPSPDTPAPLELVAVAARRLRSAKTMSDLWHLVPRLTISGERRLLQRAAATGYMTMVWAFLSDTCSAHASGVRDGSAPLPDPALLEKLRALDAPHIHTQSTLLHLAARAGSRRLARVAVAYNPGCINARDAEGQTPFVIAMRTGCFSVAFDLAQSGADITGTDATWADVARSWVQYVVEWPDDINSIEPSLGREQHALSTERALGLQPLAPLVSTRANFVETLIKHGAAVNALDGNGLLPVASAVSLYAAPGTDAILDVLISNGALLTALCIVPSAGHGEYAASTSITVTRGGEPLLVFTPRDGEGELRLMAPACIAVAALRERVPLAYAALLRAGYEVTFHLREPTPEHEAEASAAGAATASDEPVATASGPKSA